MDRKNLLVIGLGGVAALLLFGLVMTSGKVEQKEEEIKKISEEKSMLASDVESLRGQQKNLNEKISNLNMQVEGLNSEKQRMVDQLDSAVRERDDLRGEINRVNSDLAQARAAVEAAKNQSVAQQPVQDRREEYSSGGNSRGADEYWATVLKQKVTLETKLENLNREFSDLKLASDTFKREKGEMEQEIAALNRENEDLKREVEYNKKMVDGLTLDLAMETTNGFELKKGIDSLKVESKNLRMRLKSVSERKESLQATLADLKSKNAQLESSIEKMQVFMKEKLDQVNTLKDDFDSIKTKNQDGAAPEQAKAQQPSRRESVNLPPIVIRPEGVAVQKKELRELEEQVDVLEKAASSIVAINKDNNFVIINQGSTAGVKVGDSFRIFDSKNQPAGDVEVIQVRENIAACDIKKEIQPLKVGFAAR